MSRTHSMPETMPFTVWVVCFNRYFFLKASGSLTIQQISAKNCFSHLGSLPGWTSISPREISISSFNRMLTHMGGTVSYTHLRAHETVLDLVCRLLLEKKK